MEQNPGLLRLSVNNREVKYTWDFDNQHWKPIEINDGDDDEPVAIRVNERIWFHGDQAGFLPSTGKCSAVITRLITPPESPEGKWQVLVSGRKEPLELTFQSSSQPNG